MVSLGGGFTWCYHFALVFLLPAGRVGPSLIVVVSLFFVISILLGVISLPFLGLCS